MRCRLSSDCTFAIVHDGVRVMQRGRGLSLHIGYPHAIAWDALVAGLDEIASTALLEAAGGLDAHAARALFRRLKAEWVAMGLLSPCSPRHADCAAEG